MYTSYTCTHAQTQIISCEARENLPLSRERHLFIKYSTISLHHGSLLIKTKRHYKSTHFIMQKRTLAWIHEYITHIMLKTSKSPKKKSVTHARFSPEISRNLLKKKNEHHVHVGIVLSVQYRNIYTRTHSHITILFWNIFSAHSFGIIMYQIERIF
jgi:hypothetical protein